MTAPNRSRNGKRRAQQIRKALARRDGSPRVRGRCSEGRRLELLTLRIAPCCPRLPAHCWGEEERYAEKGLHWSWGDSGTSNSEEWCRWFLGWGEARRTRCGVSREPAAPAEVWCEPWPGMWKPYLRHLGRFPQNDADRDRLEALWDLTRDCHDARTPWLGESLEAIYAEAGLSPPYPCGAITAAHREATDKLWRIETCTMQQPEGYDGLIDRMPGGPNRHPFCRIVP